MKIGIDGVALTIKFPCGTKHYAQELMKSLARIDKKNQYIVFASKPVGIPRQHNFSYRLNSSVFPFLKRQLSFLSSVRKEGVDVFHYLHPYGAIFLKHSKIITTILDTRLEDIFPVFEHIKYFFQRYYCEITRKGVMRNTNTFITLSQCIRKEVEDYQRKNTFRKPIHVISLGVDSDFRLLKMNDNIKAKYLLCMTDYSPRKNTVRILQAYSSLPQHIRSCYKLKIIISTKFPKKGLLVNIRNLGLEKNVIILERPGKRELIKLYNRAACFIFPSLYEGFGLPILEAMACGCSVITSSIGAMKEVAGDAAYLVDPYSENEISQAMLKIVTDNNLRDKLRKNGLKRAKLFTWEQTARKTLEVYEEVYKAQSSDRA